MTDTEAAWVAGLLEGEGCFSIFKRKTSTLNHKAVHLQCTMTDEDVIYKLANILNVGTIYQIQPAGIKRDGSPMKPAWKWAVQNHTGIKYVLEIILPYLGHRRTEKAKEILEYINGR